MRGHIRIRHAAALMLPIAGFCLLLLLLLPEQALAASLRDGLRNGLGGIAAADMRWLVVTGVLLACSGKSRSNSRQKPAIGSMSAAA